MTNILQKVVSLNIVSLIVLHQGFSHVIRNLSQLRKELSVSLIHHYEWMRQVLPDCEFTGEEGQELSTSRTPL